MDLLIVGASARAAAFSAVRAGMAPGAIDLFADRDLAAIARCERLCSPAYPSGLVEAADAFPTCPWIYTGAIENHPDVVARLSRRRPLWGNSAEALRQARGPLRVARAFHAAGLPAPAVRLTPDGLPLDGSWLRKPIASAGGHGIVPLLGAERREPTPRRRSYYQERVVGLPLSAVFLGDGMGCARLAGVTLQLLGTSKASFAYRGSLAPWPVDAILEGRIRAIGDAAAAAFGLVGLFGVDLVLRDGVPWPVEINPRYTASVEVLELATGHPLLAAHRAACEGEPPRAAPPARGAGHVAKEVIFARGDVVFPDAAIDWTRPDPTLFEAPEAADLPQPGARFRDGEPVLTVFARGATPDETLENLTEAHRRWAERLAPLDAGGERPGSRSQEIPDSRFQIPDSRFQIPDD